MVADQNGHLLSMITEVFAGPEQNSDPNQGRTGPSGTGVDAHKQKARSGFPPTGSPVQLPPSARASLGLRRDRESLNGRLDCLAASDLAIVAFEWLTPDAGNPRRPWHLTIPTALSNQDRENKK